jgi:nucleoside-diphosphate-sugar epimerase
MKALVTGGAGFVGRHFSRALLEAGYLVTVVDDLSTGLPLAEWPRGIRPDSRLRRRLRFEIADLRDFVGANPDPDYDTIFHLAAVVGGRLMIEGQPLLVGTDLAIDATLFNWCASRASRVGTLVYFSSSAAYPVSLQGRRNAVPLAESLLRPGLSEIGMPDLSYGWAKLTGEYLARLAVETHDLRVITYRPFSGYGEDQDLCYPFPNIINRALNHEDPFVVWGSGEQVRDFIHIDDIVDAVMRTFQSLPSGAAVNLGSGIGTTFWELAHLACAEVGYSPEIVNDASKPEGVFARVADPSFMRKFYVPRISISTGVARAVSAQRHISRTYHTAMSEG